MYMGLNDQYSTRVELRLLGGFELSVDGVEVAMTPAAQRLLAFISLTTRGADRAYTAFQLWPEHCEQRAKANLRSALWRLGKVPTELVLASKTQLKLDANVWVDVRHGIAELATAGVGAVAEAALPFRALDSDLLPDWYDDWLMIERERLRQLRLGSLEEAGRQSLAAGHYSRAVQLGLAVVAIEPLRESGHRLVIEAHSANGNLFDARRQFDCYRTLLLSRMGCEPSDLLAEVMTTVERRPASPILVAV